METTISKPFHKATIVPVGHPSWELRLEAPYKVADSLSFENVEGLLNPELFKVWRDWISQRERESLGSVRFALLHYFDSQEHLGRDEADSQDFAFKAFLCLRIVKPTKTNFEPIQIRFKESDKREIDVFRLTPPSAVWPNVPDAESINSVTLDDISKLRELLPAFLDLAANGPENIRRAVRHFNAGYAEVRDPTIQIVVWCMGIESLFAVSDMENPKKPLRELIDSAIGLKTDIYETSAMREFIGDRRTSIGEVLDDLFSLRNRFVHGLWIPSEWKNKEVRPNLSGDSLNYADVLREAASFVLRRGILNYLENRRASPTISKISQ